VVVVWLVTVTAEVLDRTRWIALVDVNRIYRFGGGTNDEDGLGVVSAPYATLFLVRCRHDVKNGTLEHREHLRVLNQSL